MNPATTFLDERAALPLRERIGRLMAGARSADFAVARIRLAVLDLTDDEVSGLRRCRVLLGTLDAATLLDAAEGGAGRAGAADAMDRLLRFARGGRLQVRSAGLHGWTPDFALFRGPAEAAAVLGAVYFGSPHLVVGPSFTVVSSDPAAVRVLGRRFEELWAGAHDVLPAIREVLEQAHALVNPAARRGGHPDPL